MLGFNREAGSDPGLSVFGERRVTLICVTHTLDKVCILESEDINVSEAMNPAEAGQRIPRMGILEMSGADQIFSRRGARQSRHAMD